MSRPPLIELRDCFKTYRNGALEVEVLHGVSLAIAEGEFVAIVGASGSGKSTLMNLIGCLDRPTAGHYLLDGIDVAELEPDEVAALRRDTLGFVFQSYNLIATASALENVEVPAIYSGMSPEARRARAEELLEMLGLGDRLDHRPNQLSGGQQQRVAIARALINGARVVLADEPTGSLDSRTGAEVMTLLRDLHAQGHTVILITHERDLAQQADRLVEIRDGLIVDDTGPMEVPDRAALPSLAPAEAALPAATLRLAQEAVRIAMRSLRANLFRTALTLLGIVIGTGSVVTMLAVGAGAQQSVLEQISSMGTNLLLVRPGAPGQRGASADAATLTVQDAEAIAELANITAVAPEIGGSGTLRFGNTDHRTSVTGTTPELALVRDRAVEEGSFLTNTDVETYAPVVVLGRTVVDELYTDGSDPVGSFVLINNVMFQVVGVLAEKGAAPFGGDMDDVAYVPLTTSQLRVSGQHYLSSVTVQIADLALVDETEAAIHDLILQRHRTEDFRIHNMASLMETATATQGTLTILLGSIAAISLLVGGIGVMNIMLVNVTERTREIGIRMATGARRSDILTQFMLEALAVSAFGGALGVAAGLGTAAFLKSIGIPITYEIAPVLLAFGCAFLTGLVFGFLPARKAAGLDPVTALQSE